MNQEISTAVAAAVQELFDVSVAIELTRPDEQFGDYASNVALQLAGKLQKNPREIAEALAVKLRENFGSKLKIGIAGAGFLNFTLSDEVLHAEVDKMLENRGQNYGHNQMYAGQVVVLEHTDPNPFKPFHIGHVYSNTVGEAIRRLLVAGGAEVHQVSYHGDVGKHIAMAVWAIGERIGWDANRLAELDETPTSEESLIKSIKTFDGMYYAEGANAYKENPDVAAKIDEINRQIYAKDPVIMPFYDWGRQKSFGHFDVIYKLLNVQFERQFFESSTGVAGAEIVNAYIDDGIFVRSDGALVYKGEDEGLHTRVFMNSQGLPTYEAKELGLAYEKQAAYPAATRLLVITANEIDAYFKVLKSALTKIDPTLGAKLEHRSHGVVKLPYGKMSSRTGQVVTFASLEVDLEEKLAARYGEASTRRDITLGSMKYVFLKHRLGGDIIYDIDESLSIEGNSGPYLQYAYARAISIIRKSSASGTRIYDYTFNASERSLVRKLSEYPEVVARAAAELLPSHICTYLYELAQTFNRFYEQNRVVGDEHEVDRWTLVSAYGGVLQNGLELLNIATPEHM